MNVIALLAVLVILTSCARQPVVTPPPGPPVPTPPERADSRTRADIHTQLAAAYYGIGNFAVALDALNEAVRLEPEFGPAYNMLGLVYMELREDAKAEESFRRALSIDAQDSDANNNYGWFLCRRKRYDEGIKHIMTALKNPLYPKPDTSYVNGGICARGRGDAKAAEEFFQNALKVRPLQPQAIYQLADMAFERNDFPQARSYIERLSKRGVALNAEALWLALRIERQLGDKNAEASYGMQLRRNFPNSREAQALLNRQFE
jgi:type IV pilus assembly protein PilF